MSSDQERLQQAKNLAQAKKYDEARKILRQMGSNPTAQKWLTKIDEIDPSARKSDSTGSIGGVLFYLAVGILFVGVAAGAFFLGRNTVDTNKEQVDLLAAYAPTLTQFAIIPTNTPTETPEPTETPIPTLDPNRLGSVNNPIPAGNLIEFDGGAVKFLSAQKPSSFTMYESEEFGGFSDAPVNPVDGTVFASIELEFTCPADKVTCVTFPQFDLILSDGRTIQDGDFVGLEGGLFDEVVGGNTITAWRDYQIPETAEIQSVRIMPSNIPEDHIYAAIPAPLNGFTMAMEWDDDLKRVPGMLYELLDLGVDALSVNYSRSGSQIDLMIIGYTNELIYFEESDLFDDRDALAILAGALQLWGKYKGEADALRIGVVSSGLEESLAIIVIDGGNIDRYQAGTMSDGDFGLSWEVTILDN